ncbi:MFS transporter [Streptomyces catenulae]|uniref:MFS transporter n=1 Tax=Streptomyces catenulae TaxID=66875 RepID=A0ABV2YVF0_9ACTN
MGPSARSTVAMMAALLVSTVGDEVATVALSLRAADRTGLPAVVSAQMIAGLLPGIVLGGLIGRTVDRYRTAHVLAVTLALEAVTAFGAAGFADGPARLIAAVLLLGSLGAVAQSCVLALVPRLFPGAGAQLRANAVMESTRNAGYLAGPALVGLLTGYGGTGLALAADGATFGFALLAVPVIARRSTHGARPDADGTAPDGPTAPAARGLRAGLAALWNGGQRRATLGVIVVTVAATSALNVVMPFFAHRIPGGVTAYGALLTTWSIGLVLGPVLVRGRTAAPPPQVFAVAAATVIGLAYLLAGAVLWLPLMLAAFLCGGMANALQNVMLRTYVMADCPPARRGQIGAAYGATLQTAVACGFAAAAVLPADWSRWGIVTGGGIAALAGVAGTVRVSLLARSAPAGT